MKSRSNTIAYTTYILIALNVLVFALEIKSGGSTNFIVLERFGALIPDQTIAGEWWRLITANFLHYGWLHLGTNMFSLYFVGRIVELSLGVKSYLFVYLISGIGSMLCFCLLAFETGVTNVFLVGASAAIMGLIGTILAITLQVWLRNKNSLNAKRLLQVIGIIVLQFIFDNLVPEVSFYSHLFGLIIGFIVSSFLVFLKFRFQFKRY